MPRVAYQEINFRSDSLAIIHQAIAIADQYAAQGYNLTLRQLYYQFVSRDLLPNTQQSYKRLGGIINDARLAGLLDWDRLEDRTRNVQSPNTWSSPASIVRAVANQYDIDLWSEQDYRIEVWVEKEALADVVGRAADAWQVPYFSCRGYVSQSEMWSAAQRLKGHILEDQQVIVIHLGDHDPSGIDMTRDITDRLERFIFSDLEVAAGRSGADDTEWWDLDEAKANQADDLNARRRWAIEDEDGDSEVAEVSGDDVFRVRRIALTMDQVRQYNPPPNPAKITDSRAKDYIRHYGNESWELDALDPATLNTLITDTITEYVDLGKYNARQDIRDTEKALLQQVSTNWTTVVASLQEGE